MSDNCPYDFVAHSNVKFWTEDPGVLFSTFAFFPMEDMTNDEKLNALTRLAILLAAGMYYIEYEHWLTFLAVALIGIVLMKYCGQKKREGFSIVPTYPGVEFGQTTVAPTFAEEWQIPPPAYDLYENTPPNATYDEPMHPQQYPYGQFMSRTNLLPSDEYATHTLNGGQRQARNYANSSFTRHALGYRENMTRLYKKSLGRRFRHNCNDTFSPFSSY